MEPTIQLVVLLSGTSNRNVNALLRELLNVVGIYYSFEPPGKLKAILVSNQ